MIALQHGDVCQQPMRDQHRFGALHVRVGGHRRFAGGFRLRQEGLHPLMQIVLQRCN